MSEMTVKQGEKLELSFQAILCVFGKNRFVTQSSDPGSTALPPVSKQNCLWWASITPEHAQWCRTLGVQKGWLGAINAQFQRNLQQFRKLGITEIENKSGSVKLAGVEKCPQSCLKTELPVQCTVKGKRVRLLLLKLLLFPPWTLYWVVRRKNQERFSVITRWGPILPPWSTHGQ